MTLTEIAQKGERLATLKALRDKLTEVLDRTNSGRDTAALALQLQKVLAQIDELEREEKAGDPDELDALIAAHGAARVRPDRSDNYEV